MKMYLEADVDTSVLGDQQVTILGYGSQGRAHALNLKDSGFNVVVGLRKEGASWANAAAEGLTVQEPREAVKGAAVVQWRVADQACRESLRPRKKGSQTATSAKIVTSQVRTSSPGVIVSRNEVSISHLPTCGS